MERSELYNIAPIGIGTPFVESLTGYISRLAYLHCIKTGTLISKLITPNLDKYYMTCIAKRGGNGFYDSAAGINGIGSLAEDFINVMGLLSSRTDLIHTTLLNFAQIVPTRGLLRKTKAWCPVCYEGQLVKEQPIYDQLIWNISVVNECIVHKVNLVCECKNCKKELPIFSRGTIPGYCLYCNSWLGIADSDTCEFISNDEDYSKSLFFGEMLVYLSSNCDQMSVIESLEEYINVYFAGNVKKAAKNMGIAHSTLRSWLKENKLPQIASLIEICLFFKVNLKQFLNKELNDNFDSSISKQAKHVQRNNYDHDLIKQYLMLVIREKKPITIKKVAEEFGCDRKLISRKYPKECEKIKENFRAYQERERDFRLNTSLYKLDNTFEDLVKKGVYPSRRKMEEALSNVTLQEQIFKERWIGLKNSFNPYF